MQGERPSADPGEEMALGVSHKLIWSDIFNTPFVNIAVRDELLTDQLAQPCRRAGVEFVVVVHACLALFTIPRTCSVVSPVISATCAAVLSA